SPPGAEGLAGHTGIGEAAKGSTLLLALPAVPPSADLDPQAEVLEHGQGEGEGALLVVEADERAALPREGGGADLPGQLGRGGLQPGGPVAGLPAHPPAAHDQKLPRHRTPIVRGRSDCQGDGGCPTRFRWATRLTPP